MTALTPTQLDASGAGDTGGNRLPFDTARCGTPCHLAARCRRTTPGRDGYQTYSAFPGGDDCHGMIEAPQ